MKNKKELKVYILRELLRDKNLTAFEALLLSKLIDLSRIRNELIPENGFVCRPTNKRLSEILILEGYAVKQYLDKLKEKGYIKFNHNFDFYDTMPYDKNNFEFTESKDREIIVITPAEYNNTFEVYRKYLLKFTHKEAITYSYLDGILNIPNYKIKKSTLAKAMGVYSFQNIQKRMNNYPNLDHIDKYFIYLKKPA